MSDTVYTVVRYLVDRLYWQGTLLGEAHLPTQGPAVFVANHLGPAGPIGVICSIPLHFYTWIIADMLDRHQAADYLRQDFIEPSLKLKPPLSPLVATALTRITVPLLTSLGCIPVRRGDEHELSLSLALLQQGKLLLVFPEAPELEMDPLTRMRPFLKGFTRLGEMYSAACGERLRFYPVAVHISRRVQVGAPLTIDPSAHPPAERLRLLHHLEATVKAMYLTLDASQP